MAKNICVCSFDCHVVRACEIKYTASGAAIGNFSVAVNDSVKRNNEWVDEASFFECIAFGKTAETLKRYVVSGQRMFFHMRPKQERWVDKEGKKRSRVVFIVEDFVFGEKPRGSQPQNASPSPSPSPAPQSQSYNNTLQREQTQFAQQQQIQDFPPPQDFPPSDFPQNDYSIF